MEVDHFCRESYFEMVSIVETCLLGRCKKGDKVVDASNMDGVRAWIISPMKHKRLENGQIWHPKLDVIRTKNEKLESLSPRDRLLLSILRHELQVCKDGVQRCEQYETCCPTSTGYTCCPFFNAVCCQYSCCPNASTCSASGIE